MRWILKACTQTLLAGLPGGSRLNYALQSLNNTRMGGWRGFARARAPGMAENIKRAASFCASRDTVLEVGTGWLPLTTILLAILGFKQVHSFDSSRHLRRRTFQSALLGLIDAADPVASTLECGKDRVLQLCRAALDKPTVDAGLKELGIHYHAPADASNSSLRASSVDLFYSYNVLEHLQRDFVIHLLEESRRVLKRDGIFYAQIGLHDHYYNFDRSITRVNFLKFDDWLWHLIGENTLMFHNRLRASDYDTIFKTASFIPTFYRRFSDERDLAALRTMRLARRFSNYQIDDLAVSTMEVAGSFAPATAQG